MIKHNNEYTTLYAHLKKGITKKVGQKVNKGEVIGIISDSGNAYGEHLHFEVIKNNIKINPYEYLNKDFYQPLKYHINNYVKINGVYISSDSNQKLVPKITSGTITRIIANAKNPYLLDNGKIGWINDDCILKDEYLKNDKYQGYSIVDALKEINIDSSYQNRLIIAKHNNIDNYQGTSFQNLYLLELLKKGKLKK